jgi:ATP-dependent helicase/nuclease subunit A
VSSPVSSNKPPLQAAAPHCNATVHASAGTGKTWLLVTRIVRLLLAGAQPNSILAVTFTRKAAAEMQQRVTERLRELMSATPEELDNKLRACGIEPDAGTRLQARHLYESILFSPYPLRATTFHAFCQELLQRFPLEAGVSPGFVLSETTGLLEQQAREALFTQSTGKPDAVNRALERLIEGCDGLSNTQAALRSFLTYRSDWWAYVQGQGNPLTYATSQLEQLLDISATADPLGDFPDDMQRARLAKFAALLGRNRTTSNTRSAGLLADVLDGNLTPDKFHEAIKPVFLTQNGEPRKVKASKAQSARLGPQDEQQFIELHYQVCDELLVICDRLARYNTFHNSVAWITAGMQLLDHYQRIKEEQHLLDFADLEWKACELLNRSNHASWIQYKLDARIDHLLVDEFQDTNPTQWRLLLPLLEELAAGDEERARSVFLVGDKKQSIYSFRRANPALLGEASSWLAERLQAENYPLDASRRSAQAIIDCVNAVFGCEPLLQRLDGFNPHTTHLPNLYGRVELLPLATSQPQEAAAVTASPLRNPLQAPRITREDQRYRNEGKMVVERIKTLVAANTLVEKDGITRLLSYSDIIILLRQRTHAAAYEDALRVAGIPYLSASKGALLDNLEVRDLENLLNLLMSPYDNLALAQVLRSPVFGLSSEQLIPLATPAAGTWYERLERLAAAQQVPFKDIYQTLERWRARTGHIPVHDLLDGIFHEAEIMQRYAAAFPKPLIPRVHASLTRFIELALEIDNGRYPSLPRFLDQLQRLRQSEQDQPDESAPEEADNNRVRLMTIHGAKGLEAPVIFLADCATEQKTGKTYEALVDWPGDRDRPASFLLAGKKANLDSVSLDMLDRQAQNDVREDANLLYVAITRARQHLYISGNQAAEAGTTSWYGLIHAALKAWDTTADGNHFHETGTPASQQTEAVIQPPAISINPRLGEKITVKNSLLQIAPSHAAQSSPMIAGHVDGRDRGKVIHLMLEKLARGDISATGTLPLPLANIVGRAVHDAELQAWWQEALQLYHDKQLSFLFDPARYQQAFNEVPVQYLQGEQLVYGIIDRLVVNDGTVCIIDYKTHRSASRETLPALVESYREQMRLYSRAIARLWPDMKIRPYLLFTACRELVALDDPVAGIYTR